MTWNVELIREVNPGKIRNWLLLIVMVGGFFALWVPIPVRVVSLESRLEEERKARLDSIMSANALHLEIQYRLCDLEGVSSRECLR
jgi:hypothetical protein